MRVGPSATVQTCIVHLLRHSLGFVSWKDRKPVAAALKDIYRAIDAAAGEAATKLLFLVLNRSEKAWIMPPREWCMAKAQFAVLFGERFTRAMA